MHLWCNVHLLRPPPPLLLLLLLLLLVELSCSVGRA
jgi:hypothetical protein